SNIDLQVLNLSPDLQLVDLYIDNAKKNSTSFSYPNSSGYFALSSIDTPLQIRTFTTNYSSTPNNNSNTNIISLDTILKNNVNYSLFIIGLRASNSISYILTRDTSAIPTAGRAKIRFINASPGSPLLSITANGTSAFNSQPYKSVSKYVEMPAGNYDFKATPTGLSTTILSDLPAVTVQDGKIYTLYCRGIVGRIDTAAFGLAIFNNRNTTSSQ
ncbi:MAG: hypothetical protein JWR67_2203, partial [Mucilaginibacter sp.]|nr:hypothetical protein [Mucilaginibacter sp.]